MNIYFYDDSVGKLLGQVTWPCVPRVGDNVTLKGWWITEVVKVIWDDGGMSVDVYVKVIDNEM